MIISALILTSRLDDHAKMKLGMNQNGRIKIKQSTAILAGFILIKFFLQSILIDPVYDLHRDEFLHLDQANHLAWGYESVPPFTSWLSFTINLLGSSVFIVKLFPAFFGALTMLVIWKAIELLGGSLYAKILGATCILLSVLLRLNTLFQPNSFDVLCWTTVFFFLIKYMTSLEPKWLYWGAVFVGVGFLNKYNIVFLVLGLLPAILLGRDRNIFLRKEFYLATGLTLLIISPNLLWQYFNDFPVFDHLSELTETQLVHVDRIGFFKNQLLFFTGSIPVILAALYALVRYKAFRGIRFLFWSFIFTLVIFTWFKAKDYYAIGLYPIYLSIGSVYLANITDNSWGRYFRPLIILLPIISFVYLFSFAFPNKTPDYIISHKERYEQLGLLHWEDGNDHEIPQDFADMLGWKELANKVDQAYGSIGNPDKTLILCDNYGQAGAINFYSKNQIQAISFDADYVKWFNSEITYVNLIRVKNRHERNQEWRETSPLFKSSMVADSITNRYAREFGTTIFVFEDSNVDINGRIEKEIEESGIRQ